MTSAERAQVTVRGITGAGQNAEASALLARVWGTALEAAPLPSDLLVSLSHAGGCVLGAFAADRHLVGTAVCLAGKPCSRSVYSLIAAVGTEAAGQGVGAALKLAQRAWALDGGATNMLWTFDPLVRRNAHFNINRLGARVSSYAPDFYPPMHDAINQADLTDRLVADWDLTRPAAPPDDQPNAVAVLSCDATGHPVQHEVGDAPRLAVAVPRDIESVRRTDPDLGRQWRLAVRDALQERLAAGHRIVGFLPEGAYVLERGAHD